MFPKYSQSPQETTDSESRGPVDVNRVLLMGIGLGRVLNSAGHVACMVSWWSKGMSQVGTGGMGLSDHPRVVFTGASAHLHPPKTPTSPLEAGSPISQPGPPRSPLQEQDLNSKPAPRRPHPLGFFSEVPTLAQPMPGSLRVPPPTF